MSGSVDISFKCPNCGALIELKEYELNEPNWAADHARDQLVDSDGDAYCKKCGESFTLWVLNDFDSVYVQIEGCEPEDLFIDNLSYEDDSDYDYDEYIESVPDKLQIQTFIDSFLSKIKSDFINYINQCKKSGATLCDVNIDFRENVLYERKEIQQHYFLRYFYAYFLEYHYIYKKINLEKFNVLSIGCGPYVDLASLYFVIGKAKEKIKYYGIDPVDWNYKDDLEKADLCCFFHGFLDFYLKDCDISEHNIFVFPKSMEYLDISLLVNKIEQTVFKEKTIYLVLNGMQKNFESDEEKLDMLSRAFSDVGYRERGALTREKNIVERFKDFPEQIQYTDKDWLKTLSKECVQKTKCIKECPLDKYPILKTTSFFYKIIRLEKYDY